MQSFNKIFFRGLLTLLPIAITIYVVYSAVVILDDLLGSMIRMLFPNSIYIPGFGFILILILIFIFGLLLNNFVMHRIFQAIEQKISDVPFIKTIYSPLKDLMNLFSKRDNQMGSVVLVKMGDTGARAMGLITRESFVDLSLNTNSTEDKVAVYFPLSYGMGGFTFLVPKANLEKIDLPVEKAMSLAITGWVKAENKK